MPLNLTKGDLLGKHGFTMWQVENNLEHILRSCVVTLRISSNLICRNQKTNISYYSVLIMIGVDGDKRQQQPLKSCQVIPFASSTVAKELLAFWAGFTRLLLLDNGLNSILKKHNDIHSLGFSQSGSRIRKLIPQLYILQSCAYNSPPFGLFMK